MYVIYVMLHKTAENWRTISNNKIIVYIQFSETPTFTLIMVFKTFIALLIIVLFHFYSSKMSK